MAYVPIKDFPLAEYENRIPDFIFEVRRSGVSGHHAGVAGYTRSTAQKVLFFNEDTPTYGGTPAGHTMVQIVDELKARGLNVIVYPMPFVDTITPVPKPWRGRIEPASATGAASWFTRTNGYNAFITRYASLVKNKVDAFVIVSELTGMTGFTDAPGRYTVKDIMGDSTQITYAADRSEYHSTHGRFTLDPLRASTNIDFAGIDSYFPLTPELPQIQIDEDRIREYREKGEGRDYYRNGDRTVQTSYGGETAYAWKNLEHWRNSTHTNPDSRATRRTAKMKPARFTEFGFPSVDGAARRQETPLWCRAGSCGHGVHGHFPSGLILKVSGRIPFCEQPFTGCRASRAIPRLALSSVNCCRPPV